MRTRIVHSSNLTSECWMVQVWGKDYCKSCQYRNNKDCGGQTIRATGLNAIQKRVPIE